MADNVAITAGSGTTISTEEVSTLNGGSVTPQHVQRLIAAIRTADGTAVDQPGGAGAATAGTQRVVLATDQPQLTNALKVDGSAVTQPVSGTVGISGGSLTVDGTIAVSSSALPAGAATESTMGAASTVLGTTADTAAGVGSSGTISAKLRTATQRLSDIAAGGNVAHDAPDAGSPVKVGGRARTALPAAVAQDDRADAVLDKYGRRLALVAPLDQRRSGTSNYTGTSAADVIAAPGASTAIVVTRVLVTNASTSIGTKVTVRDGTTAKIVGYAAAGGGFTLADEGGLFVASSNAAVTAICGTTGADVDVTVFGYTIPV